MNESDQPAVRRAGPHDASSLLALRIAAEHWLAERGIQQWGSGEVTLEGVAAQLDRGEWFISTDGSRSIVAAARFPFYADLGYRQVGRRDFDGPWFSAALFEKQLIFEGAAARAVTVEP